MEDLIPERYAELYIEYNKIKKELEEIEADFKAKLIEQFESNEGTTFVEKDGLRFTYVKPSVRVSVDGKKLEEEEPEIYQKYLKETKVRSSIRTSII